jgi:membrane-anchored protein YejM (alkaline phosphatase superfamily)
MPSRDLSSKERSLNLQRSWLRPIPSFVASSIASRHLIFTFGSTFDYTLTSLSSESQIVL